MKVWLALGVALGIAMALGPTRAVAQAANASGPDLTVPMLTRDQAEGRLPPPVKVVDLSKPGNVYKSSDPLVAAAVADYLSKIKEPHDQFGNIITKNYKSATLPDTVDSKVIAAIVAFVGNQRFIALSPRAAQSLAATQHIQRQKDIDKIIYDDWANKVRAKAANFNGNSNRPASGGGEGTGPGGGNANTPGPSTGGNENVPNLNNGSGGGGGGNTNQPPSQAGTGSSIAQEFGVVVSAEPQPWTEPELSNLRNILQLLPRNFYKGMIFKRQAVITEDGKPAPTQSSDYNPSGEASGTATISDFYQSDTNGTRVENWPTPPWPEGEAKSLHLRNHLVRTIMRNFLVYGEGRAIPSNENKLTQDFASTFGWTFDSAAQRWRFTPTRRNERVSTAAIGSPQEPTSPQLDMSESLTFFLFDPARLKATSAEGRSRFNWIREKLGLQPGPEDPKLTVGPPATRNIGN